LTRHHEIPEESISGSDESSTTVSRSQTMISRDEDDNQGAGVGVISEINPPMRHVAVQTRFGTSCLTLGGCDLRLGGIPNEGGGILISDCLQERKTKEN